MSPMGFCERVCDFRVGERYLWFYDGRMVTFSRGSICVSNDVKAAILESQSGARYEFHNSNIDRRRKVMPETLYALAFREKNGVGRITGKKMIKA